MRSSGILMRPFPRLIAAALAAATAALAVSAPSHRRPAAPLQQLASTSPAGALLAPSDRLAAAEQNFRGATGPVAQLVALYRAEDIFQLLSPRQVLAGLDRFAAAPNVAPLVQAEIANQRAAAQLRAGDAAAATALWQKLGVVTHWRGVGPFDNSSPSAIATPQGPENSINFTAEYQGKQHSVRWRTVPYSATRGELELSSYFSPAQSASAYLVSWVRSPAAQSVALRLRDSGSTRLWVNGHLAFDEQGVHSTRGFDQHAAGAHLAAGWNEILAKVGDSETADWLFSLRITTPEGAPLALESTAAAPATVAPHAAASAAPVAVTDLAAIAKSAASTGEGELNYAWILARKQNFNAGDHSDANAFMSAIASLPNDAQAVLDFAEHDSDTSRIYQNLETLLAKSPGVPHALELLGMIELARNEYWPARADLLQSLGLPAGETSPASIPAAAVARAPMAALGLLEVNAGMGIRPQVLAWAEALKAAGATTAAVAAPVSATLRRMGAAQDSLAWIGLAHASDQGNVGISLALADAQRRAGDLNAALATLQQAIALNGELPNLQETLARALTGLNRQPEALAAIAQAVTLAPDNPEYHLAQGELERHFGHATSGLDAWQTALNLNPQDNDLRDRLKLARGSEGTVEASFELPYTQDLQHAIANYQTAVKADTNGTLQSGPVVILADSTVINIFPSGNNGRYVQQIFRINNSTGADALAVYS
ncbi:MAG TPA: tetratricopeptide repeat protein, partial [Terriglobales bacterium]|nr:tetratricopeptide repeat protein [Terriglobales bacterium]